MRSAWIILLLLASFLMLLGLRLLAGSRRRRLRNEYQRMLQRALDDGVLTQEEVIQLEAVRAKGALSPDEVRMAALAIYRMALRDAAADARLTPEEDGTLRRLQEQLGLSERDLGEDFRLLSRLRLLARITEGMLPQVQSPISLVPGEYCHWVVQCTLAERIAVPQSARRELTGIRFGMDDTEPFSAGGPLSALRPAAEILPIDIGALIITSRRTIFQGAKRTVTVPHARAESIELYADGVRLDEAGSGRRYFLVEDGELTCAVLLGAARSRRIEIRPARADRTA